MRGERHVLSIGVRERLPRLLVSLDHVVRIAVVTTHEIHASQLIDLLQQLAQALVTRLAGPYRRLEASSMAHHIWTRKIDAKKVVTAALQGSDSCLGDLLRLHVRLLVEGALVARNLHVRLPLLIKVTRPVAIPKEGDVAKLLRLTARENVHAVLHHVLPTRLLDERWRHQVFRWELQVPVVLEHASKLEALWVAHSIESLEVLVLKRFADLDHPVRSVIEQHNGVVVLNGSNRASAGVHDHERLEILVVRLWKLSQLRHGFQGRLKLMRGLSKHVGLPASLDDPPVRLIPVHRHVHASAARGDQGIAPFRSQLLEILLQLANELDGRAVRNISSVGENMQTHLLGAGLERPLHQLLQLLVAGVDATVTEQSDQMQRVRWEGRLHVGETLAFKQVARLQSGINQACSLLVHCVFCCRIEIPEEEGRGKKRR